MYIKLENIKISKRFRMFKPKLEKMYKKIIYYAKHRKFKETIVLDDNNVLVDGYTTYLLAKKLGKKIVKYKRK